jgi:hypothetical protein
MTWGQETDVEVIPSRRLGMTARAVRRAQAVSAVVLVLALAGCGSSSKGSSAATAASGSSSPATTASGTTAPGTTARATTTSVAATTSVPTSSSGGSGGGGSFCHEARSSTEQLSPDVSDFTDPTKVRLLFTAIKKAEPALLASAPASIKGDLSQLFAVDNQFLAILKRAGYNFEKVPPAAVKTIERDEPKIEAASKAVDAYLTNTCGISTAATT